MEVEAWVKEFIASDTLKPFDNLRFRDCVQEAFQKDQLLELIKCAYTMVTVVKLYPLSKGCVKFRASPPKVG
jgi:hypothetical protein